MGDKVEQEIAAGDLSLNFIPDATNLVFSDVTADQLIEGNVTNTIFNPEGVGWGLIWSDTRDTSLPLSLNMGLDTDFIGETTETTIDTSYFLPAITVRFSKYLDALRVWDIACNLLGWIHLPELFLFIVTLLPLATSVVAPSLIFNLLFPKIPQLIFAQ